MQTQQEKSLYPTEDNDEAEEGGTIEQLTGFFKKYANFRGKSTRCALDGRYFWKVLKPYIGLVPSEIYIRINDIPETITDVAPIAWDHEEVDKIETDKRYRLVKIIIDVDKDPASNKGSVHSNLLYIDTVAKEVVRFEPLADFPYTEAVNDRLREFFSQFLPNFRYRVRADHPQLSSTEKCPTKGMCAAYVLKAAMLLVNGMPSLMNGSYVDEEKKILRFAAAIQEEYGMFDDYEDEDNEVAVESGLGSGLLVGGLGVAAGVGLASLYYNSRDPYYYDHVHPAPVYNTMYPAPYYGYTYGHRPYRKRGWGWGRRHNKHYGSNEWGCGCGSKRTMPLPRDPTLN